MRTNGICSESVLEKELHKLIWDFEIQTDHLISIRPPDIIIIKKEKKKKEKKRTRRIVDLAVPANHRVRLKEGEKKYLDLAWELEKPWDIKVTVIPIVIIGALGTVTKGFVQRL